MAERPAVLGADRLEVVRSEESLVVAREVRESGRVRVSKRIVTEEKTITVTVRREELVITELPPVASPEGFDATGVTGPDGRLLEVEAPVVDMVLHEERVVTSTVVVPVERVRVHVKPVATAIDVEADVAHEVVTLQGKTTGSRPPAVATAHHPTGT